MTKMPKKNPPIQFKDGAAAHRTATQISSFKDIPISPLPPRKNVGPGINTKDNAHYDKGIIDSIGKIETRIIKRVKNNLAIINEHKAVTTLRNILDPKTYRRAIRKQRMQNRSEIVDDFGLDPVFSERLRPYLEFLYRNYWNVQAIGINNVPDNGRAIIVSNHSGTLSYDGAMLMYALRYDHPAHRTARPLLEDSVFHFPFLGLTLNRMGGVRACQANAELLLKNGRLIIVFPEGTKSIPKPQKNLLGRFGRGGFIKLALKTKSPIIPTALVGSNEIHPLSGTFNWMSKQLGDLSIFSSEKTPLSEPLGMFPLPGKWFICFGTPIDLSTQYKPDDAQDSVLVTRLTEQVRETIQMMLPRISHQI